MGIVNKDNALYMATGIDNSGLYSGRREALGIIRAMAGEITSFDVFGGIGISAGIAFAKVAKGAYDFEKQFQQSMKEVATLSSGIKGSLADYMNQILDITKEIPVQANDAAKALYQIVSAGHDGADGMKILEVSAKAAIGGVTDTATAADAITTVLNAYKMNAGEAENISNQLFTTVRLGKTTFGELGHSIAQVAPIAAAYGVEIDQVLAAVATLTKQGTPTAQAMTQIRAAIVGVSKYLGDGAYNGRTFQEALELVRQKAGGSEAKLREFIPEIEAVNGLLGLTGQNAQEAAGHLAEMSNSTGAAGAAFEGMVSSAQNQLQLLQNNITAVLRSMGEAILKEVSDTASSFNEAFENGNVQKSMETLGSLIVVVTGALIGYKGSIMAVTTAKTAYHTITTFITKQKALEAANLVLTKGMYAAEATMVAKNTGMHVLLTNALKAQLVASVKVTAAMLTNPYVLAAGAVAFLGYTVYKLATAENEAERAVRSHNIAIHNQKRYFDNFRESAQKLLSIVRDESAIQSERVKAYKELQKIMPVALKNLDLETLKTMDLAEARKLLNKDVNRQYAMGIKVNAVMRQRDLDAITAEWQKTIDESESNRQNGIEDQGLIIQVGLLAKKKKVAEEAVKLANEEVRKIREIESEVKKVEKKALEQATVRNKAYWEKQRDDAQKVLDSIASSYKRQLDAGNFNGMDDNTVKSYRENARKFKEAEKELNVYDNSSKKDNQAEKLRKEQDKYNLLLDKQVLEQKRSAEDLQIKVDEARIKAMDEGSAKTMAEMELNFEKEMQAIDQQKEDALQKKIEDARTAWEANPKNNGKSFDATDIKLSDDEQKYYDELYKIAIVSNEKVYENLVEQYLSYTDQRISIEENFNDDIAMLQEARKKAEAKGDINEIAKIDRSIEKRTEIQNEDVFKLDAEEFKKSMDWEQVFGNLDKVSTDTLKKLKVNLKDFISTQKDLSPENFKELVDAVERIDEKVSERNPFETMVASFKSLKDATEAEHKAQEAYNKTLKKGTDEEKKNAKATLESAKNNKQKALSETTAALHKGTDEIGQYVEAGNQVIGIMETLGVKTPQWLEGTMSGFGEMLDGLGSIDLMKPMSIVTGGLQTIKGALTSVISLGGLIPGISADYSEYNAMVEKYDNLLNVWDELIAKKKEYIDISYGSEALKAGEEALLLLENQKDVIGKLLDSYARAGSGLFSHSKGYKFMNTGFDGDTWQKAIQSVNEQFGTAFDKGTTQSLTAMTTEQLQYIKEHFSGLWSVSDSTIIGYLENLIDYGEQADEIVMQLKESITGMSFDEFKSGYADLLSDLDSANEDFSDNFEKHLQKAIFQSLLANKYKDRIKELYDAWAEYGKDGLSSDEVQKLRNMQQQLTDNLLAERDKLMQDFGWQSESESTRGASQKTGITASQDSVDENNGRLAVMQEYTYSINERVTSMDERLTYLSGYATYLGCLPNIERNMGNMAVCCNAIVSHLSNIDGHTARLEAIENAIVFMKNDINTMLIKGLKLSKN